MLSGQAVTPSCTSNNAGVNNTDPSLSGLKMRHRHHQHALRNDGRAALRSLHRGSSVPEADRPHFNLAAFRIAAQPNGHRELR